MNRLKPWLAMIVLALWASCTIRCELVCLTGSNGADCCVTAGSESPVPPTPANDCVCSWAKSGGYTAERNVVSLPLPVLATLLEFASDLQAPPSTGVVRASTTSPPDLPPSWQFSVRAALSPRAPSFVS